MNTKINYGTSRRLPGNKPAGARAALLMLVLSLMAAEVVAQTYSVLHHFPNSPGSWSGVTLVEDGPTLYGTTWDGGTFNHGTVFTLDTSGNGYKVVKSFTGGVDGGGPLGLVLSGTTLYGTTFYGGTSNLGTVFRLNTDGSGHTVLKSFTGYPADGANANGGLLLSGGTLYGTTEYHGAYVFGGTLFKLNTDGSGYTMLHSFSGGVDGSYPVPGQGLSGTTLYGATGGGGSYNAGVLYKVSADGSGYQVLRNISSADGDGYYLEAGPALSGATLYGPGLWGGASNCGVVYKVNTDGSGYKVLHSFDGRDGKGPIAGVLVCGSVIYGTTWSGGSSNRGTIFQLSTDGGGYSVLHEFTGPEGRGPNTALVLSGTNLCGMTTYGGDNNGGVVFRVALSPPVISSPPRSQTAEAGTSVGFRAAATGSPLLVYQWFFNDNSPIGGSTTNGVLLLTNVQAGSGGAYFVVASNFLGALTSSPGMLSVIAPVERRPVPGVKVTGEPGSLLNVEHADSFSPAANWIALGSLSLTGTSQYCFDLTLPLPPQRFYRAVDAGPPGVVPSLDLRLVPAITLTGNVGDSWRLDYIHQFGPIDAWTTLDTVTLTNTSQLYFDVSAPGQPQRFYRLVPSP